MIYHDILGLDIGHAAIKTALFRKGVGRAPTFLCRGTRYPTGLEVNDSTQEFREFLSTFLKRHQLLNYPTVTSIPGECVLSRVLTFPFSNIQKISKTLPFELEPFVPVPVDELVIDYHVLTSTSRQTQVLVVAVSKEHLHQRVELLTKVGLNVQALEVQGLAIFNAYRWMYPNPQNGGTLLLDIGYRSTSLCLIGPKGIWGIRTLLFGVRDLDERFPRQTKALGRGVGQSEDLVKAISGRKEENPDATLNKSNDSALEGFLQNLRTTIHAFESQTNVDVIQTHVGGGGASVEELPAYLASQLELPNLQVFSMRVGRSMRALSPVFLPALGLSVKFALRSTGSGVNFYRKMTEVENGKRDSHNTWVKIAVGVGILAALSLMNVFVIHHFKESRYEELQHHLRSQFQEVFPQAKVIVDEIQQTQSAIIQDQRMLKFFSGDHTTVLQILAELSQRLGQEGATEVHEVLIDGQTITLQATTRSFEAVERIKQKVSQVSWVQALQVIDAQVGPNSNRVKFGLTVQAGTA